MKDDAEYAKWLNMLIAPGSSLGGARPKANILDNDGALWIAKFPSGHDTKDMGAWEAVTAEMAKKYGIEMAESRAQKFSNKQHTFLTKRFDRINGKRIHFASAMTLLGYTDGADSAEGVRFRNGLDETATRFRRISNNYGDASFSISQCRIATTIYAIIVSYLRLKKMEIVSILHL